MSQSTAGYFSIDRELIDIWEYFVIWTIRFVVNAVDGRRGCRVGGWGGLSPCLVEMIALPSQAGERSDVNANPQRWRDYC